MIVLALLACGRPQAIPGTQVRMDFASDAAYAAPHPSDHRRNADGTVDLSWFPRDAATPWVEKVLALADGELDGFGTTAPIHFATTGALDPQALPDVHASVEPDAKVFLVGLDDGRRTPVDVSFEADAGPYGAPNLLTLVPLQGVPLQPGARYAAVVLRDLGDADGEPLGVSLPMAEIARGRVPEGLTDEIAADWHDAVDALDGVDPDDIAGMAVFTTGNPRRGLEAMVADALSRETPAAGAWEKADEFDTYCVYRSTVAMPVYQAGEPPFQSEGGGIVFDDAGNAVLQGTEEAAFWVTVPKTAMPADGWPAVVMIPTGGGGDRPLVDRGVHAEPHGDAIEPGAGPALHFAAAGFAGVSVDGPHGGIRNVTNGDQQFLMFNMTNPEALLDNVRQSALEVVVQAHVLDGVSIDVSDCPGTTGPATFDTSTLALFGHSMGATIAPSAAAMEPRYGAIVLSGAGGSWIANVVHKQSPLEVRPIADILVGYDGHSLDEADPLLGIVQWAGEATDPPVYAGDLVARGTHALMFQGMVDTYILPPIANPLSLSLGVDLAGEELDDPAVAAFRPLSELLPLVGADAIALPATGNRDGVTAVVVQHREDGIEDGHEVVFQLDAPKEQYATFLRTWRTEGVPTVP